jgi:hypothetical protein
VFIAGSPFSQWFPVDKPTFGHTESKIPGETP